MDAANIAINLCGIAVSVSGGMFYGAAMYAEPRSDRMYQVLFGTLFVFFGLAIIILTNF